MRAIGQGTETTMPTHSVIANANAGVMWINPEKPTDRADEDLRAWVQKNLNEIADRHRLAMNKEVSQFMAMAKNCWPTK